MKRKRKVIAYILTLCLVMSNLIGVGPLKLFAKAAEVDGIVNESQMTFNQTTPSAYTINADGSVTIQTNYQGEQLYFVGDVTSWDSNQKLMTKDTAKDVFIYTTEEKIAPGIYNYKFKPNKDNWDGNFNADGIVDGANSQFIVPGIKAPEISIEKGKTKSLGKVTVINEAGGTEELQPTYSLVSPVTGVTLIDNTLTVAGNYDNGVINVKIDVAGQMTEVKVKVVSALNKYIINYVRTDNTYTDWNLWLWDDKGNNGTQYNFGAQAVEGYHQCIYESEASELGFIVRKGDWEEKDIADNRTIQVPAKAQQVEVWLIQGDKNVYYSKPNLDEKVRSAFAESPTEVVAYFSNEVKDVSTIYLKDADGNNLSVTPILLNSTKVQLRLNEGSIKANEKYEVGSSEFKPALVEMTDILDDPLYYYEGDDLGLTYNEEASTFKVWAPTATDVKLIIYNAATDMTGEETNMERETCGVWQATLNEDLNGLYYSYKVSFANGMTQVANDPYAKAVSINGEKAAIVNLDDTDPNAFDAQGGPALEKETDAIIYEVHVRDLSSQEGNGFTYPKQYLGFTEKGLTTTAGNLIGIDHLKELGITHVQLQPVYDYATVDEKDPSLAYNWGYDPQNYNVPEGSYATDPSNPYCRINEFKQMVQALHDEGIGVIMDVVYNHTYNTDTAFEKIVPGYYYRKDESGQFTNGSGCGNEIASERPMVRKFIKDSTKYWMQEYGIDGFRFDLMGLIDTETMRQITKELKEEVNPHAIIYGEPWTGGTSGLASEMQTVKGKQKDLGFGVFNDNIRNAIKGDSDGAGKGFATGSTGQEANIAEGIKGSISSFASQPTEVINYVTAHDNLNLWDKVLTTMGIDTQNPYASITESNPLDNEAIKRDLLSNGIVFTSQGVSFMHAGEEFLRTKYGDHNSYKSLDSINQIVWENKDAYKSVFDYYQGLIALRKAHPAFRMATNTMINQHIDVYQQSDNLVAFTLKEHANGDSWQNIVVIYNANMIEKEVSLPSQGSWQVVVNDKKAGTQVLESLEDVANVKVAPLSMMVLYDQGTTDEGVPTTIESSYKKLGIPVGEHKFLKATVKDQKGASLAGQKVTFKSADESIVTVSAAGKVEAKAVGKTVITMGCGKITTEVPVEVVSQLLPTKLKVNSSKGYVYVNKSLQLTATILDQFDNEMSSEHLQWHVNDPAYATVDRTGKVVGIKEGSVSITASVGTLSEQVDLYVKAYKTRYITLEYIREDQDYTDWNLWVWSTGSSDGQIDPTEIRDGKAIYEIQIGPEAEAIGFIIRKGTDWSTCKQDIETDRYIYTDVNQVVTKARIYAMKQDVEMLTKLSGPVMDSESAGTTFYYRDDELFKIGKQDTIKQVIIEINGKPYEMKYDAKNEIFTYTHLGITEGKTYYRYQVTYADGRVVNYLDAQNTKVENGLSVFEYKKLKVAVKAQVNPGTLATHASSILEVAIDTSKETEEVIIKKIVADLSSIGGSKEAVIAPDVKALALTVSDTIEPGQKVIPVKVYDQYGNIYSTQAEVAVTTGASKHFDWDEAVIYFMLTDRFNNGDTSNDDPYHIGYNKALLNSYHGGDFKGVTAKLDYLKNLGVNTIWITPIVEQIGQSVNGDYAYHGYWAKDFEQLNPHLGSIEDLKQLIDAAHDRDMKIMVDVVLNHTGYGMKVGDTGTDPQFPTPAEQAKYEGMLRTDGSTDTVYGEIAGLPDFMTEKEEVRNQVINWQKAWLEKCTTSKGNTIDYFRIDTVKHLDKATLEAFKVALQQEKPDFRCIGEAWLNGSDLDAYLNKGLVDGVLNFDFKNIASNFVKGNLEQAEAELENLNDKASSTATYGNFLGSHDEDGFLYKLGMEKVELLKIAATLQATSKGQPVIYYGEEIGLSGANNSTYDNRYDMDWSKVAEGNTLLSHYQKVFNIRKAHSKTFAKGTREKLAGSDEKQYMAFLRSYGKEQIVVAINNGKEQTIELPVPFAKGSKVKDEYSGNSYTVGEGQVTIQLPSVSEGGTVILTMQSAPATPVPSKPSSNNHSSGSSSSNDSKTSSTTKQDEKVTHTPENNLQVVTADDIAKAQQVGEQKVIEVKAKEKVTEALVKQEALQALVKEQSDLMIQAGNMSVAISKETMQTLEANKDGLVMRLTKKEKVVEQKDYFAVTPVTTIHLTSNEQEVPYQATFTLTKEEISKLDSLHKLGVYKVDEAGNLTYVGGKVSNEEIRFTSSGNGDYIVLSCEKQFTDIDKALWAKECIETLVAKHIVYGKTEELFDPNGKITRAEVAALLARCIKTQEVEVVASFKDVKEDSWYAKDVALLKQLHIVNGDSKGNFNPTAMITKQELAAMLVNAYAYMKEEDLNSLYTQATAADFKDGESIAPWAKSSVNTAKMLGVINGNADGELEPNKATSRAEATAMVYNLLKVLGEI